MPFIKNLLFYPFLLVIFTSCNRGSHPNIPADQLTEQFVLIHSKTCGVESGFIYDEVVIEEMAVEGNMLRLNVMYGGGCKTHCFSVAWDKVIINSDPPSIVLALLHNSNKDLCEALISDRIHFQMGSIKSHLSEQNVEQVHVVVQYGNKLSEKVLMKL